MPSVPEFAQHLRSEGDPESRSKIVGELWELATPEAVEVLRQQFYNERDGNVKADIVAGLVESQKPETREVRFGILVAALGPAQPSEVRLVAVQMLTEFEDNRALAMLQNLANDRDEEIRAAAKEAIEARAAK